MSTRAWRDRALAVALPIGGTALIVGAWQVAVMVSRGNVLPGPGAVALGIVELAETGRLLAYVLGSLARVAAGFGLALLTGIPLGLAMGWFPRVGAALNPVLQLLRPISPLAWIPLVVVALGIGNAAPIALIYLAAVCVVAESAMHAVRMVSPVYTAAARNFGLSPMAVFARAVLPAALPQLLGGVRVALGVAWVVVVAAEMIAVESGLGYLIIDARNAGKRYDLVVAGMVLIGVTGLLLDHLVARLERLRFLSWGSAGR